MKINKETLLKYKYTYNNTNKIWISRIGKKKKEEYINPLEWLL
jgi:hypothetical protein